MGKNLFVSKNRSGKNHRAKNRGSDYWKKREYEMKYIREVITVIIVFILAILALPLIHIMYWLEKYDCAEDSYNDYI